ncbi:MAG: endo-1,4-beta-xylanase, partial [Pseudomonadota bacterium]|nr:endo-1,4-beta-xylanase [Pseudomonadota bacterium]
MAPFPVGAAVRSDRLADPAYAGLLRRHFDQITADWEMKMEVVLGRDGRYDWTKPDRIAGFARDNGLRLFGHTLIWYAQDPPAFKPLIDRPRAFEAAFRNYIDAVAGRYAGQAVGWDVVNEAVDDDGVRLRGGYFEQALGLDYIEMAFRQAHRADPRAVLFLNDYGLERDPTKRRTFIRLAERLLKAGAPIGGVGTQSHFRLELDPAKIGVAMRDLAGLGLPIHVSEADVSLGRG